LLALLMAFQVFGKETPLASQASLESELWMNESRSMYEQPPFRYRIVFRAMVDGATLLLGEGQSTAKGGPDLYIAFVAVSVAAWFLALAGLRALLRTVGLEGWRLALGLLAFTSAFPVVQSYGYPTHTREDPLAYACIAWGLALWLQGRWLPFLVVAMLGVATRETLLTLGVVHVVGGPWKGVVRRVLTVAPLGLVILGIRMSLGWEDHPLELGREVNMLSWKENAAGVVFAFGWMWPAAIQGLLGARMWERGSPMDRLQQTWRWVLPLTIGSVVFAGILRESRLLFLVAPWVIAFAIPMATKARSDDACRRAFFTGSALLAGCVAIAWSMGRDPHVIPGVHLGVYSRWSWPLLIARHAAACVWAWRPRRASDPAPRELSA
jgi:hypothetical protein